MSPNPQRSNREPITGRMAPHQPVDECLAISWIVPAARRRSDLATRRRKPVRRRVTRWILPVGLGAALLGGGIVFGSPASADEAPPYHILSTQNVCNLVWPRSQAMANPAKFGAVCVRQNGLLFRLARSMPAFMANSFVLDPGSAVELPVGSVRINPDDPLSDWIIPDCYVSGRIDCVNP